MIYDTEYLLFFTQMLYVGRTDNVINIASKVSTITFIFPTVLQLQGKQGERNVYGWIPTNSFYRFSLIRGLGLSRKEVGERLIYLFLNIIPFPFFSVEMH